LTSRQEVGGFRAKLTLAQHHNPVQAILT
jgi:hypothetical protein